MNTFINSLKKLLSQKWLNRILLFLTLFFVGRYLIHHLDWEVIKTINFDVEWLILAVFANFVYILLYAVLWHIITCKNDSSIALPDALAVWLFSNCGKYLPLKVAGIGYRMVAYQQRTGKRYMETAQLCYIEQLATLLGGCIIIFILLLFSNIEGLITKNRILPFVGFALGLLFLLLPQVQRRLFQIGMKILKKEPLTVKMSTLSSMSFVAAYAICWVTLGTTLFCLTRAVYPNLALIEWCDLTLVYALAGMSGIVCLFAPSGIGVREGVLMAGLSMFIPPPIAAIVTIMARIITILVEWIGILIGFLYLEGIIIKK